MKKVLFVFSMLLFCSCAGKIPFLDDTEYRINPESHYINLQVKLQSTYSLFKALNAGIITQEEYDQLKKNILDI